MCGELSFTLTPTPITNVMLGKPPTTTEFFLSENKCMDLGGNHPPLYGRIPYNCFRHPLFIWPHMH